MSRRRQAAPGTAESLLQAISRGTDVFAPLRQAMPQVILITAMINVLALAPTVYMLQVYDRVMSSFSTETLAVLTSVILLVYGLGSALEWTRSRILVRAGNQMDMQHSPRIYQLAFRIERIYPGGYTVGQALSDFGNVRQFATGGGLLGFLDAPWTPFYLLLMFFFHPMVGWYSILGGMVLFGLTIANERLTKRDLQLSNQSSARALQIAGQQTQNAEVIEALGMFDGIRDRWMKYQFDMLNWQTRASDRAADLTAVTKFVRMSTQSLILGLGAYLAIHGEISSGMIIAGSVLMGRALAPIEALIGGWKNFGSSRIAWERLQNLLNNDEAVEQPTLDLPTPTGQLSVEQAVIAPSRQAPPVLAGIALSLERGDVLAVIGPSGSGKSCLCRGLVGVWPLLGGAIRLDGAELSQYGRKALARHVGYLPQAVEILDGSVAENIARMGEVNDAEVIRACQLSGVHDLVVRLPEGYGTKIGMHGGLPLSPGQRQRLGLARAIYGEAKIVVLDEPNSNLDEEGEKALERCVHTLRDNGVTVVIVTHRPAILKISTKVLLLNNGKQIAFGPTAEVLGNLARKVAAFPQAANARGAAPGVSDEGRV